MFNTSIWSSLMSSLGADSPGAAFGKIILVHIVHVYMSQGNTSKREGSQWVASQDNWSSVLWGTKKTTQNMTKIYSNWRLRKGLIQQFRGWGTASPMLLQVKNLPAVQEIQVQFLGWKAPWRRKWQPTPIFSAWRTPWPEEPGRLQSKGWQRIKHDWAHTHGWGLILGMVTLQ